MRKVRSLIGALAFLPVVAFAQGPRLAIGPAVFLKSPSLMGQGADLEALNTNQISVGVDLRFRMRLLMAEALTLMSLGEVRSINVYLGAGVAADIGLVTLSLGAGPHFIGNLSGPPPVQAGFNARFGIDLNTGRNSIGLSYITAFNIDDGVVIGTKTGLLGARLLFWL